jgi:hypothetical protein
MERVADDDMVENFDFKKLPSAYQVACNSDVGFRRRSLSARVIMREHEGGGRGHNGQPKDFAGMNQNRVLRADADQIMAFNTAAGIEHEHNKTFTFDGKIRMRGNMQPPIIGDFLRCIAQLQTLRRWTFPQRSHLKLVRLRKEFEGLDNLEARKQWGLIVHGVSIQAGVVSAGK